MQRRRFLLAAASAAAFVPLAGLPGCGNSSSGDGPQPVPPEDVVLSMPEDMYLHPGSPTEWWWHIGTLKAGERVFGFEINAASFLKDGFAFSQIMLTDVEGQRHYKRTTPFVPPVMFNPNWAQSDVTKDWYARLGDVDNQLSAVAIVNPGSGYTSAPTIEISGGGGSGGSALAKLDPATGGIANIVIINPGSGYTSPATVTITGGGGSGAVAQAFHTYVAMAAPAGDPTQNMTLQALLYDDPTGSVVKFDLTLSQQGRPFFVYGTGVNPDSTPDGGVEKNNYYFSLTRLQAAGTIEIDGESFAVSGVTWMDHEYGFFGTATKPVKWILQDFQLDNGFCISNFAVVDGGLPDLDETVPSQATLQDPSGNIYFVKTLLTPIGRTWTSPETGATYFTQFRVEIAEFDANLVVTTLFDSQEFPVPTASVYEGVADATGTFKGKSVTGTAWIEQEP